MLAFIATLLDRVLFTIAFIAGVQLPAFIQQYIQRLAGRLDEAQYNLAQYQHIADIHYQGSLDTLAQRYLANSDITVVKVGEIVQSLILRVDYLSSHLDTLQQANHVEKLWLFVTQVDTTIAQNTLHDYSLSIPIELNALIAGGSLAFLYMATKSSCAYCGRKAVSAVKQRSLARKKAA
ncbi:DUF2937 family protein [Thalassotalea agarivorans]|uniref:DUF2937 domain-containing protein n=1 Tax=Thalassotalea agarivorans TaxID=349064 RepID=A0A1I0ER79_THASX|nr:DUF2937 family protein [Thalassotalea agarivorans]SET47957.1 Protein of unknown function [Thalassotalea agarivorans]